VKPASEVGLPLLLKSLCLPTFAREYAAVAVQAVRGGLSHEGYLLALAEQEASQRCERRVERLLQESKLPREKSLAGFDMAGFPPRPGRPWQRFRTARFWIKPPI
jgi:DNA replication protein DnaC